MEKITVDPNNNYYSDGGGNAIIDTNKNRLITACNNTVIPSSVKSIAEFSFEGLEDIKSIDLPSGLTQIENYTFRDCEGLTSITIPDGVTTIGMGAFEGCEGLISICLPDSVTYIDTNAFASLQGLRNIYYTGTEEEYLDIYESKNGKHLGMGNHYYLDPGKYNHYYNYDPDHAHVYGDWFVWCKAALDADGTMLRDCTLCEDSEEKAIPRIVTPKLSCTKFSYTGKAIEPKLTIKDRTGKTLKKGTDYSVIYSNNKAVGKAKAKIKFAGSYYGQKTLYFKIEKAKNPIIAKAVAKTVKYSKVSTAKQTIKGAIVVKKNRGAVTYAKVNKGSSKVLTISRKGIITVKKGSPKGAYKIKVKLTAKGDKHYKAGSKTVIVKITVK